MEDNTRIRLIIVGLVLASFAIGYFIFSQRFQTETTDQVDINNQVIQMSPTPEVSPSPSEPVVLETLPATGFPLPIIGTLALSAVISGFFLRKFPN